MRRLRPGDTLLVATHNAGKLAEIASALNGHGVNLRSNADLGLAEPAETETTFLGNARIKAQAGVAATGLPTIADDSGLCVDALDGAPGVASADWAEGPEGRDYPMAMQRIHDALAARGAPTPWRADFVTTLVLRWPDGDEAVFDGISPGQIVWPPRGAGGHGYDPVFQPDGSALTFAEMSEAEKNAISHRGRAVLAFARACLG